MELEAGSKSTVFKVSYQEEFVGRRVKHSKVRVTWTFVACGGREHYVVLTWSKATGKQEIQMNGSPVWFGRNKGGSVLDHHWTTPDRSLKIHVLATCAPKLSKDFRSYDLLINGQLFVSLPRYHKSAGLGGSEATEMPWMNQNQSNNYNNPSSIIEILYPEGYNPPVDKTRQQQQQERQKTQETSTHEYQLAIAKPVPSDSNSASHPPMVDLLM